MSTTPIASAAQFKMALLAQRDKNIPPAHLDMLCAQAKAPNGAITATKPAEAADYENFNAANLQYGTLAKNIAGLLQFDPRCNKDGSPMWWTTLATMGDGSTEPGTEHFLFVARPELQQALREMRWVKS